MWTRFIPILIIAVLLSLVFGCEPEPFSVESVTLSKDISEDFTPVDPTDEFSEGTSIIYISVKVNNMTPDDKITITLNYLETDIEIYTTDFSPDRTGSGYQGFELVRDSGYPTGSYTAVLYVNDVLYETIEFSVK